MSAEEKYVAAAYGLVFLVVLLYVLIMAAKLSRLERELTDLARLAQERKAERSPRREEVPVG